MVKYVSAKTGKVTYVSPKPKSSTPTTKTVKYVSAKTGKVTFHKVPVSAPKTPEQKAREFARTQQGLPPETIRKEVSAKTGITTIITPKKEIRIKPEIEQVKLVSGLEQAARIRREELRQEQIQRIIASKKTFLEPSPTFREKLLTRAVTPVQEFKRAIKEREPELTKEQIEAAIKRETIKAKEPEAVALREAVLVSTQGRLNREVNAFNRGVKNLNVEVQSKSRELRARRDALEIRFKEATTTGEINRLNREARELQEDINRFQLTQSRRFQRVQERGKELQEKQDLITERVEPTKVGLIKVATTKPVIQDVKVSTKSPIKKAPIPRDVIEAAAKVGETAFETAGMFGEAGGALVTEVGYPLIPEKTRVFGQEYFKRPKIQAVQRGALIGRAGGEFGLAITPVGTAALAIQIPKRPELVIPVVLGTGFGVGARLLPKGLAKVGKVAFRGAAPAKIGKGAELTSKIVMGGLATGFVVSTGGQLLGAIDRPKEFKHLTRETALELAGFVGGLELAEKGFTRLTTEQGLKVKIEPEPAEAFIERTDKAVLSTIKQKGKITVESFAKKPKAERVVLERLLGEKKVLPFELTTKGITTPTIKVKRGIEIDLVKGKKVVREFFKPAKGLAEPIEVGLAGRISKVRQQPLVVGSPEAAALAKSQLQPFTTRAIGKGKIGVSRFDLGGTTISKITRTGEIFQIIKPSKIGKPSTIKTIARGQKGVFRFVSEAQIIGTKPIPRKGLGTFQREFTVTQIGRTAIGEIKVSKVKAGLVDFPKSRQPIKIKATIPKQTIFFTSTVKQTAITRPFKSFPAKTKIIKPKPVLPKVKATTSIQTIRSSELARKGWKIGTEIKDIGGVTSKIISMKKVGRVSEVTFKTTEPLPTITQARPLTIMQPTKVLTATQQAQIVSGITQTQTKALLQLVQQSKSQVLGLSKIQVIQKAGAGVALLTGKPALITRQVTPIKTQLKEFAAITVSPTIQTQITLPTEIRQIGIQTPRFKTERITQTIPVTSQAVRQAIKTEQKTELKIKTLTEMLQQPVSVTQQETKLLTKSITKQIDESILKQALIQELKTQQIQRQVALKIPRITEVTKQKIATFELPKIPFVPPPIITKTALFLPPKIEFKKPTEFIPSTQAFAAFIKTPKGFKRITRALTLKGALAKGILRAERTAKRTFLVEPVAGKPARISLGFDPFKILRERFRKPIRKGVEQLGRPEFIEKTAFAINTKGEREEITFKGIKASIQQRKLKKAKKKKSFFNLKFDFKKQFKKKKKGGFF